MYFSGLGFTATSGREIDIPGVLSGVDDFGKTYWYFPSNEGTLYVTQVDIDAADAAAQATIALQHAGLESDTRFIPFGPALSAEFIAMSYGAPGSANHARLQQIFDMRPDMGVYNDGAGNLYWGPQPGPQHSDSWAESAQSAWNDMKGGFSIIALPFAVIGATALVGAAGAGVGAAEVGAGVGAAEVGAGVGAAEVGAGVGAGVGAAEVGASVGVGAAEVGASVGAAEVGAGVSVAEAGSMASSAFKWLSTGMSAAKMLSKSGSPAQMPVVNPMPAMYAPSTGTLPRFDSSSTMQSAGGGINPLIIGAGVLLLIVVAHKMQKKVA